MSVFTILLLCSSLIGVWRSFSYSFQFVPVDIFLVSPAHKTNLFLNVILAWSVSPPLLLILKLAHIFIILFLYPLCV